MTTIPLHLLAVDLTVDGSWAVGGVSGLTEATLPVAGLRDDTSPAFLPATGLVGALRVHLGADADRWLGPPAREFAAVTGEFEPTPSPLRVLGVRIQNATRRCIARTTAIDSRSGAASGGALRAEQYIDSPDGVTTLRWHLVLEQSDAGDPQDLVEHLKSWRPFVGRRRTSGFGKARVTGVHHAELDLSQPAHLTWWLSSRDRWFDSFASPDELSAQLPDGIPEPSSCAEHVERPKPLEFDWVLDGPLHIGTGEFARDPAPTHNAAASDRNTAAATVRVDLAGRPVVPGSAWKGIFRHRAEFILAACGLPQDSVATLFGVGGTEGRMGKLRFHMSTIAAPAGTEQRGQVRDRRHVAIDRITGGVYVPIDPITGGKRGGTLFALQNICYGTMRLTIDTVERLDRLERALLLNVARDLHEGLIGIGHATTRGYGTIRLTDPKQLGTAADRVLHSAEPSTAMP